MRGAAGDEAISPSCHCEEPQATKQSPTFEIATLTPFARNDDMGPFRNSTIMSLLQHTRSLCKEYGIRPLRKRGQNFLINPEIIQKIIQISDLKKKDIVLEIGAGTGALTKEIAKKVHPVKCRSAAISPKAKLFNRVKKVIAVEIDKRLVKVLQHELKDYKNVQIIHGDARKITSYKLPAASYKLISNLPFNITGLVLRQVLQQRHKPKLMVLVLQKQVGQRIIAKPPKMSLLAISVQFYAQAEIISQVSKNNFWPRPRVDSVILKIITKKLPNIHEDKFFKIVKAGFSSPRKYVLNNLCNYAMLNKQELAQIFKNLGLSPKARAQELSVENWIKLTVG